MIQRKGRRRDPELVRLEVKVQAGKAFGWLVVFTALIALTVAWVTAPAAAYAGSKFTVLFPLGGALWALIEFIRTCRRVRVLNKERWG